MQKTHVNVCDIQINTVPLQQIVSYTQKSWQTENIEYH